MIDLDKTDALKSSASRPAASRELFEIDLTISDGEPSSPWRKRCLATVPSPQQAFKLLDGAKYSSTRNANNFNSALRREKGVHLSLRPCMKSFG